MSKRKHLIIGCGSAGLSALKQMRKLGSDDEIKLVAMEECPPYSPMSLPYLISGRRTESEIYLTEGDFFDKMDATLVTGRRAESIDTRQRCVVYDNGESDAFDTLLIATGSEPVRPGVKGLNGAGFLGFHTLGDFHELDGLLKEGTEVIVLGAGLVGVEVAAALSERGLRVKVVEREKGILPLYFDEPVGQYISEIFAEQGIEISTGVEVTGVRRTGSRLEVTCSKVDALQTDLMVSCVGVRPRVSMADGSGIKTNRGIVVDNRMRTNIEGIFAAGDVAEAPEFFTGKNGLSFILPSAVDQGKIAGSNMMGKDAVYDGWLSSNVFNFFGHLAVSIGEFAPSSGDHVLAEKDDDKKSYRKLILRDDRLAGANFFNTDVDGGVLQYLVRNRVDISPHEKMLLKNPKEAGLWLMQQAEAEQTKTLEN